MPNSIYFEVLMTPYGKGTAIISKHGKYSHLRAPDKTVAAERTLLAQALQHKPEKPWEGAVGIEIVAIFTRPKNHYRTGKNSHLLKDDAPKYHIVKPDASNVLKMVEDSLKEVFFKDDCQLPEPILKKRYGPVPMFKIRLWKMDDTDGGLFNAEMLKGER